MCKKWRGSCVYIAESQTRYIKKVVELMLAILLAALESEADKQKFTDIYEQYRPRMEPDGAPHFEEPA